MKDQIVEYAKQNPVQAAIAAVSAVVLLFDVGGVVLRVAAVALLAYACLRAGKQIDL